MMSHQWEKNVQLNKLWLGKWQTHIEMAWKKCKSELRICHANVRLPNPKFKNSKSILVIFYFMVRLPSLAKSLLFPSLQLRRICCLISQRCLGDFLCLRSRAELRVLADFYFSVPCTISTVQYRGMDTAAKLCPCLCCCTYSIPLGSLHVSYTSLHAILHPTSTAMSIKCGN